MLWIIIGIISSYLIGSIPTAYIFGRVLKGIDIRKFGSGNVGATNALRTLGRGVGVTVLILDILKGFIVVFLLGDILGWRITEVDTDTLRIILGISAIIGHNWTVFLDFHGGKGIATTFGVLLGLAFKVPGLNMVLALAILTWLVVFIITRIVSLSSILAAIGLPIYMVIYSHNRTLQFSAIMLVLLVLLRHRANLKRLMQGKEPKLSFKKQK